MIGTVMLLVVGNQSVVYGQAGEEEGQVERPTVRIVRGLELEAELRAVDPDLRIFLVVGEEGNEMLFHYDSETEVVGHLDGVQGLAGRGGTWTRIEYRAEGEKAIAERISTAEESRESSPQ
ncbi:MAG: hypothetical protein R3284_06990 [Rubricoccaceae bacterium]|nr:hypothetical protein [Rubricoccaceae bacterium]